MRARKRNAKDRSKSREFDIIAACDDTVIVSETSSSPRIDYINEFREVLKEICD